MRKRVASAKLGRFVDSMIGGCSRPARWPEVQRAVRCPLQGEVLANFSGRVVRGVTWHPSAPRGIDSESGLRGCLVGPRRFVLPRALPADQRARYLVAPNQVGSREPNSGAIHQRLLGAVPSSAKGGTRNASAVPHTSEFSPISADFSAAWYVQHTRDALSNANGPMGCGPALELGRDAGCLRRGDFWCRRRLGW